MSKTPLRSVRIDAELWDEAQRVAKERGDTISSIIRDALRAYLEESKAT